MATSADDVRVLAEKHGIPAEALAAAVSEEFARRADERKLRREAREAIREPANVYAAMGRGQYRRQRKPRSAPEDRELAPAAMRHWRLIHGLTTRQAQARIGYSQNSSIWRHWENGFNCPPFSTLLKVISATGLGYWVDDEHLAGRDADLRLPEMAHNLREERRVRRAEEFGAAIRAAPSAEQAELE